MVSTANLQTIGDSRLYVADVSLHAVKILARNKILVTVIVAFFFSNSFETIFFFQNCILEALRSKLKLTKLQSCSYLIDKISDWNSNNNKLKERKYTTWTHFIQLSKIRVCFLSEAVDFIENEFLRKFEIDYQYCIFIH